MKTFLYNKRFLEHVFDTHYINARKADAVEYINKNFNRKSNSRKYTQP